MRDKKTPLGAFLNGLVFENPTFVLMLGMCPTLGITTMATNGIGMGLATTFVLVCSNLFISLLRNVISDKIRIPAFIVIIASFVTMLEMLMKAFLPALNEALGQYVSLIVVNCIILARAEAFAYKNPVLPSVTDGLGMGMGFTVAITLLAAIREVLGSGTVFGLQVMPEAFETIAIFNLPAGGFITLGLLLIAVNAIRGAITKAVQKRKEALA